LTIFHIAYNLDSTLRDYSMAQPQDFDFVDIQSIHPLDDVEADLYPIEDRSLEELEK
jgi:hypothetical protein